MASTAAAAMAPTAVASTAATAVRRMLAEADVGITEYMDRTTLPFTGIIKHRYSDFLVNEVDLSGSIVRFRGGSPDLAKFNQKNKEKETELQQKQLDQQKQQSSSSMDQEAIENGIAELSRLLGDANADAVAEITACVRPLLIADDQAAANSITTKPLPDKTFRTQVHNLVRTLFPRMLETITKDGGCIEISRANSAASSRKSQKTQPKPDFTDLGGEFGHFTLYKENVDTMHAITIISRLMKVPSQLFNFCGTKDKRAITVQRVSVYRIRPKPLLDINRKLRGIRIGDIVYKSSRLSLGSLSGNHFSIALRDVKAPSEDSIRQSMETFAKQGFINYYGMQRFGTRSISTHTVGVALLSGKWADAIEIIMSPKDDDEVETNEAREHWKTHREPEVVLKKLHPRYTAERSIMKAFCEMKNTTNHLGAIQAIPRTLRMMYSHAYQSYVWNHMASERIRMYGYKPVVGDLVLPGGATDQMDPETLAEPELVTEIDDLKSKDSEPDAADGIETSSNSHADTEADTPKRVKEPIYIGTEEDAAKYTMADVVLPQPGYAMKYPKHAIADKYVEFMAKDGFDPLSMERKIRDFSLPGFYRAVVAMPRNISWRILRYDDDELPLLQTDLDRNSKKTPPESIPDGKYLGLTMEFTLGSSQYATMAVREITKGETGSGFQTMLSHATKRKCQDDLNEHAAKK